MIQYTFILKREMKTKEEISMSEIKVIKVFNLVDTKGTKLQLRLGLIDNAANRCCKKDTGLRWSFVGSKIPMPVRNGTWFNGFPADTMMLWLAENDWYVATEVEMATGKAKVHVLPEPEEAYTDEQFVNDEIAFNCVLKELNSKGRFGTAVQLYSYAHNVGHWTARQLVKEICGI